MEQQQQQTDTSAGTIDAPTPATGSSTPPTPSTAPAHDLSSRLDGLDQRVTKLEESHSDEVTVSAPQPDPEVTAQTAAAVGQSEPVRAEGDNPPEGRVDPQGRSDGSGLATEGNEPPTKSFISGW